MKTVIVLMIASFLLISCKNETEHDKIAAKGTVRYITLEGGFFGIEGDDGGRYLPENLAEEFRKDSLRIYFEGTLTDRATTQMWGRTITLTRTERLP